MSCPCDSFVHPPPLSIGAGLIQLPRQIATFADFRRAMLNDIKTKAALARWSARQNDDLGVMLLEMWAYICDSVSFYDKVISQEEYLRTAIRRPSLRKLIALLGYIPRPAVGSSVTLTAIAEGRQRITLPVGTAFTSGAFEGSPPQVFELDSLHYIHPFFNNWKVVAPHPGTTTTTSSLLIIPAREIVGGQPALILNKIQDSGSRGVWISEVAKHNGTDGRNYRRLTFSMPATFPSQQKLADLQLFVPTQSTSLWTMNEPGTGASVSCDGQGYVVLSNLIPQIKSGQLVIVSKGNEARWFRVLGTTTVNRKQHGGDSVTLSTSTSSTTFALSGVSVPVTLMRLDKCLNDPSRKVSADDWTDANRGEITVHFGLEVGGEITDEPKVMLSGSDPLLLEGKFEKPLEVFEPENFALVDVNIQGIITSGQLDAQQSKILANPGQQWNKDLTLPVTAFGNLLSATRGESVKSEVLGSGDAIQINQTFKLKNNPLTYLPSPTVANSQGVENTLTVYVDGVKWKEVPSFFNRKPDEPIYLVRQNDDEESQITFGDGIRGRRLPTGVDNITADYRFGAGALNPPAGIVNQISTPVKGLQRVSNPLPAGGGQDAENQEGVRRYAPRSVLTLGRAVSMLDMEAVTANVPGVDVVAAEWRWHGTRQSPVVQIWYIGDEGIEEKVVRRLLSVSEPSTPIHVTPATPLQSVINIDVQIDPRYITENVLTDIRAALTNPEWGILSRNVMGIGKPLFRSRIFSATLAVEGTMSVRNVRWNNMDFTSYGIKPGAGEYFEFGISGIQINGISDDN